MLKDSDATQYVLYRLQNLLSEYLVGQHIAQDLVVRAVRGHARLRAKLRLINQKYLSRNPSPSKPLVLSMHGWTGSGKNFISQVER